MRVTFTSLDGFSQPELKKLFEAKDILESILNSADYRQAVLNADFSGETSEWADKSNEEILKHILSGREVLSIGNETDQEADISLSIFNPNFFSRNTVGYTYPNTAMQWISRKFFRLYSAAQIAGNLMHEWLHKMGFDHDFRPTLRRKNSVCYVHNEIIEALARDLSKLNPTHSKSPRKTYSRTNVFVRFFRYISSIFQ